MKHPRRIRWRAALLATLSIGAGSLEASDALGRDTAGPEAPHPPATDAPAARAPAAPSPTPGSPSSAPQVPPGEVEAASTTDAERAKQLYAAGAEAFAAQRNADAIRYFRRAAEIVPSTKLTYNIGLAYEEMGDSGRALVEYRSYLTRDREADAGRIDEVRGRIANLERRLAETGVQQLLVTSEPTGATVRVAGRAVGVTPWAGELAPGQHRVELDLLGHTPRAADVTLAPDRSTELALTLAPAPRDEAPAATNRSSHPSPLAWTFLGVGAGGLAGGLMFELSRAGSSRDADRAIDPIDAAEARGSADAKQMASIVLFGFGAGFAIGGAVLLAVDLSAPSKTPTQPALGLPCTPTFCGVLTQGHF